MRKIFVAVVLFACLATIAQAQESSNAKDDSGYSKWGAEFAGGTSLPTGTARNYATMYFALSAGVSRAVNRHLGAQLEYNWNMFQVASPYSDNYTGSRVSIQSVSINPYVNLNPKSRVSVYVIGGVGYYWRSTEFENPTGEEVCTGLEGCIPTESCAEGACWTNSAFGENFGVGLTWRIGSTRAKVFVEARYVRINTPATGVSSNPNQLLPNYRTSYMPATAGIRF